MNYDTANEMFRIASELVNQSSRSIFLTGKAGTGKTTFLKYIRQHCPKQMAVVAPTGVAAINAGGVTIHSFFQLPISPFIPEVKGFRKADETVDKHSLLSRLRMTNEKKKVLRELELLIIDEISMVRCDTLDAIDTVLRHIRSRHSEMFGGVQVLFIGDMFQLPPVIKDPEWNLLSEHYISPYFFDSHVIRQEPPLYIEFNKIYRQSEERFIQLLNQVRNNELDEEGRQVLSSRFQPGFRRSKDDGYIILTTHNDIARETNGAKLQNLEGKLYSYKADIEEDFPPNAHPADEILQLKAGAQVMFIKNDSDKSKRYFNGKIGTITKLEEDKIFVQCQDEPGEIEVKKERWENIRYSLNKTTRLMDEEVLGSFVQFPLRLAWAITIHKSQGLTFEKAIIDAGRSFAAGQVYVALSRCTNLDGLVLQSEIRTNSLFTDPRIVQFSKNSSSSGRLQEELAAARKHYQEKLLLSTFDFRAATTIIKELQTYLAENNSSFNPEAVIWLENLADRINTMQDTANKFHNWIRSQFQQPVSPEENIPLQERTVKAAEHFVKELELIIIFLQQSPAVTDSRLHAKEYNENIKEVFGELAAKKFLLQGFDGNFDVEEWHSRKRKFVLPGFSINAYAGATHQKTSTPHPELHLQLRKLRDSICAKKDLPIYIVAGSNTLNEMARYLPQTLAELRKISGFGDAKIGQYGQQFLEVILEYSKEKSLSSLIHEKSPKRERKESTGEKKPKVDTKTESYRLFKEGMTADEIAGARNLTVQTIEGHLAFYVSKGVINIEELVSREKLLLIEPAIQDFNGGALTSIKERLGNAVGFGEIKLVVAWRQYKNSNQ
ncbi:MAG TPA: helix-turn-helix domain-containing protein [Chitinophagaceae bacterium]